MEGINLISSTYSDDDDDDEIEHPPHQGGTLIAHVNDEATPAPAEEERTFTATTTTTTTTITTINSSLVSTSIDDYAPEFVAPRSRPVTPQLVQQKLTIVDYGHDEVAMSPEAEEREVVAADAVMIESQIQMTNGNESMLFSSTETLSAETNATTSIKEQEQLDGSGSQAMAFVMNEPESAEVEVPVDDSVDGITDDDLVLRFLPPPPEAECSDEQQERINKFLKLKGRGKSYNAEVRNKKEYRNPDFLRHAVTYQDIDEIGSCFRKEVFDPHGYDKSDFYDEIEADMKRELERKEQERKKKQAVEFVTGGTQSGVAGPSPRINIPIPAAPTPTAGGVRPVDSTNRDGRSKKSKWDKVDGDQTTAISHPVLLTAANASSGYTAFAQQRRRETEEKKYIERKIERRS